MAERSSVFVCGGALTQPETPDFQQAEELAYRLSRAGFIVVHGGGPGSMEAVASGAKRACEESSHALPSIGFAIRLPTEQVVSPSLAPDRYVELVDLSTRQWLCGRATHVVVTPGGWGTLYEQVEHFLRKGRLGEPGLVVNLNAPGDDFWNRMMETNVGLVAERGLIRHGEHLVPVIANSANEALTLLTAHGRLHDRVEWDGPRGPLRIFQPNNTALTLLQGEAFQFYYQQLRAQLPEGPVRDANAIVHDSGHPLGAHIEVVVSARHTHVPAMAIWALVHTANIQNVERSSGVVGVSQAGPDAVSNPLDVHIGVPQPQPRAEGPLSRMDLTRST